MSCFEASAPGKVILFGEHAVVHGSHAVASSLDDLRVYARLEIESGESQNMLRINLNDLGIKCSLKISDLVIKNKDLKKEQGPPRSDVLKKAHNILMNLKYSPEKQSALLAVIYLCMELCPLSTGVYLQVVSAGLPIGAGLGSSAAFSVAISAVLLAACGVEEKKLINAWAFCAEVILHGSPSGLDNAMSCFGGHALFVRDTTCGRIKHQPLCVEPQHNIYLLITNTQKLRSTKKLVQHVASLLQAMDKPIRAIFQAIDAIALDFAQNSTYFHQNPAALAKMFTLNHHLLQALQVSDPALETVVHTAHIFDAAATKLTGAGGGGCAITLLYDTQKHFQPMSSFKVQRLISRLQLRQFRCYQTKLGGSGVLISSSSLPGSPFSSHYNVITTRKKKNFFLFLCGSIVLLTSSVVIVVITRRKR